MDQLSINVRINYITLIVGVLITAAIVLVAWKSSQKPEVLLSIVAAGAAVTALVYTAINSQFTRQVHLEELRVKKLENAMAFIERSTSSEMIQAINLGVALREEVRGKNSDQVKQIIKSSPRKKEALVMIFNYFERLGVIVRLEAADEQALKDYYQAAIRRYWHSFNPWVHEIRSDLQDTTIFTETEKLVKRWS